MEGFPQNGLHEGVLIGRTGMLQNRLEAARFFLGITIYRKRQ